MVEVSEITQKISETYGRKVDEYACQRLWINAAKLCDMIFHMMPTEPKWGLKSATLWYNAQKYDNALEVLASLQTKHPKSFDLECLYLVAQCHAELDDWGKCTSTLSLILNGIEFQKESVISALGDHAAPVLYLHGTCLEIAGERKAAADVYTLTLSVDPYFSSAAERLTEGQLLTSSECFHRLQEIVECPVTRAIYTCRLVPETQQLFHPGDSNHKLLSRVENLGSFLPECKTLAACVGPSYWLLLFCAARRLFEASAPHLAVNLTSALMHSHIQRDECITLHITVLVTLKRVSELHHTAHALAAKMPCRAVSWYAVGCYYYSLGNYEKAGVYFERSANINVECLSAWVGYGHCCYFLEEGEQALKAYRNVQRLFPGSHKGCLFIGMQYSRSHSWRTATVYLEEALHMAPNDPLVLNELGIIAFRAQNYELALKYLRKAVETCPHQLRCSEGDLVPPPVISDYWEPIFFNLASTYRKLRDYKAAKGWYEQCLVGLENCAHVYSALGFTCHLDGDLDGAIENYHSALSMKPSDTFVHNVLKIALSERFEETSPHPCSQHLVEISVGSSTSVAREATPNILPGRDPLSTKYSQSQDIARVIYPSPFTRPSISVRTDSEDVYGSPLPPLGRQLQF